MNKTNKIFFSLLIVFSSSQSFSSDFNKNLLVPEVYQTNYNQVDITVPSFGDINISFLESNTERTATNPKQLDCQDINSADARDYNAVWIWNTDKLMNKTLDYISEAKTYGATTFYVQLPHDINTFTNTLKILSESGIKVVATTGDPEAILNFKGLLSVENKLKEYNSSHDIKFKGFQIDVEPYTLKDFPIRKVEYLTKYISLVKELNENKGDLEFSVVVPFWLSEMSVGETNVLSSVLNNSDYVSTMSYRTNIASIYEITNNSLCMAAKVNKKVMVGLEYIKLPNEIHYIIPTEEFSKIVYKNSEGKKIVTPEDLNKLIPTIYNYKVNSKNLSFYNDKTSLLDVIKVKPPYLSFKGWSINGLSVDN